MPIPDEVMNSLNSTYAQAQAAPMNPGKAQTMVAAAARRAAATPAAPERAHMTVTEAQALCDSITATDPRSKQRGSASRRADDAVRTLSNQIMDIQEAAQKQGRQVLLASEQRLVDEMDEARDVLMRTLDSNSGLLDVPPGLFGGDDHEDYAEGKPLAKGQSFAGYVRSRGIRARGEDLGEGADVNKYLRGVLFNQWKGADREMQIANTMSGATTTAGGVLIPTVLMGQIIDLARGQCRVLEAGAQLVPMESRTVDVAKWTQDPTFSWRTENAIVAESDGAVDKITLTAKDMATVVRVSRDLVEDTDIVSELGNAFAAAFALKIDNAALYADGTGGAPTGVKANANVTKTLMGANGAAFTDYGNLIDAKGRLRDQNEYPTAQIMADRSARVLAKLRASAGAGDYLTPPEYLADLPRLTTSQIPTNLTVGTATGLCSDVFTADWSQLLIGVRSQLVIQVLQERYMTNDAAGSPTGGQYGFAAFWRGDVQLARPKAFDVLTAVL